MTPQTERILAEIARDHERSLQHDRVTPSPRHPGLTIAEAAFLEHNIRWGSDGHPIAKIGRGWHWQDVAGVRGAPTVYRTKRECVEAIERYLDILRDKMAGRL